MVRGMKLIGGCFALALGLQAASADEIPIAPFVKESGKFTIADTLAYAPFDYLDESGKPAGLSIELAQAAAKLMGAELDIKPTPFASFIPALTAGRVKIAWAAASVTQERLKQVDFVAWLQTGTVASTLPENKAAFASRMALCGKSVAIQTGTAADFAADQVGEECKKQGLPPIQKAIYPSQQDTVQSVITGRNIAYLDDATAAGYYSKVSNGRLVLAGEPFAITPIGHIISKGDKATAEMLKAVVQKMMDDGTYKSVLEKYGMQSAAIDHPVIYTDVSQLNK